MTKDEQKAIKILKRMIRDGFSYDDGYGRESLSQDEKEACEMGIKALEQKNQRKEKCYKLDIVIKEGYHHIYLGEDATWSIFDDKIEVYESGKHYTYPMYNVIFYRVIEEEEND